MVYDLRYYVTERVKGFYILTEKKLNDEKFNSKFFRLLFSPTSCFCVPSKCPYSHGKEKFYIKRARDHSPNYLLHNHGSLSPSVVCTLVLPSPRYVSTGPVLAYLLVSYPDLSYVINTHSMSILCAIHTTS